MITTDPIQIIDADEADKKAIEQGEFLAVDVKECDLKAINHSKRQFQKLVGAYQESYRLTCIDIDKKETSRIRRKLMKRSALKLTRMYFGDHYRSLIDLKGMIKEDLLSRKMRDYYREEDIYAKQKSRTSEDNKPKQKIDVDELLEELDGLLWKKEVIEKCERNCRNEGFGLCFCTDSKGNYFN